VAICNTAFDRYHTLTLTLTHSPPGLSCRPSVCSSMEMGMPTFLERPATTTFFPMVGIPETEEEREGLESPERTSEISSAEEMGGGGRSVSTYLCV